MKYKFSLSVIIAVLGILLTASFSQAGPGKQNRPNIVLIVIDTLRKDHLSCYGYERNTTPNIDALANNGLLFEDTVSQAPWTAPSMASMFTSLYPSQTGVGVNTEATRAQLLDKSSINLPDHRFETLADRLGKNGYKTIAVTSNPLTMGVLEGFKDTKKLDKGSTADKLFDAAMRCIDKGLNGADQGRPSPFFVYIHFMDIHVPCNPPPPYDETYVSLDPASRKLIKAWDFYIKGQGLDTEEFRINKGYRIALYDGALKFIDSRLGLFLDFLKSKGLYDKTVIAVASDHGEEFWDHALFEKDNFNDDPRGERYGIGHGHSMFKELLDVPLIFSGMGVPKGRIPQQTRNLDIAPTLLGLAGAEYPSGRYKGVDVISLLNEHNMDDSLLAFSEGIMYGYEKKSLQNSRYKYIRCRNCKAPELLFDKTQDPSETVNLVSKRADIKDRLSELMDELLKGVKPRKAPPVLIDEETKKQLRSLGYIQ